MDLFDSPSHLVILIVVVVALFGWKKMPDAARSLGRSMRIFKSEINQMKKDDKVAPSAASSDTVKGETAHPIDGPAQTPAADPVTRESHNQPPA
jgi:sec-independent protein translocase protein TatA